MIINKSSYTKYLIVLFSLNLLGTLWAEDKLGQTGFQFLSVGPDARAGAMANAVTSIALNSSSLFYNPAGLSRMEKMVDLTVNQTNWIADITHNAISAAIRPVGGRFGVFGLSLLIVDYGEVQGTMQWDNEQGYILTEKLNPAAFSAGLGYARSLTDKFSVGGQVKYNGQQLGKSVIPQGDSLVVKDNLAFGYAFDFGTLYRTGFKSLVFGMSVRNFSKEFEYEEKSFQLPLTFTMGLSVDMLDFFNSGRQAGSLLLSIDALHYRSYPEQLKIGLEYGLMSIAKLRLGYHIVSDEQKLAFGFGLVKFGMHIDYAYTPFGVFDNIQKITIRFSL